MEALMWAIILSGVPRLPGDHVRLADRRHAEGGRRLHLDQPGAGANPRLKYTPACGWWFILWHWVPIYANILNVEVFVPLGAIVGADGWVSFFSTAKGLFWASVITAFLASAFIALGIRVYARIQKVCFYGGLVGLGFMMILLLVNSKADFISALNTQSSEVLGTSRGVIAGTLAQGAGSFRA